MAIEARRGCGFRKVGGLYLVSGALSAPCCRLPLPLNVCPCCGEGIKQTRGFRWVIPGKLFASAPQPCSLSLETSGRFDSCIASKGSELMQDGDKAGLLWVGAGYYRTPAEFTSEAAQLGVSKRIASLPLDFKVGQTWVLLAHPAAVPLESGGFGPGVFAFFRPLRVERIVKQSEVAAMVEALTVEQRDKSQTWRRWDRDQKRGITWVAVPDDDPDHCTGPDPEALDLFGGNDANV